MIDRLKALKQEAKRQAARKGPTPPAFITECKVEIEQSRQHFFDNPLILKLQQECLPLLYDDTGFGIEHAKHTAIDAGALALKDYGGPQYDTRKLVLASQVAGMLHDICRTEGEHAARGAEAAEIALARHGVEPDIIQAVMEAIARHEDVHPAKIADEAPSIVAACLYDADKFRWGPDFFTTLFWELTDYLDDAPETFIETYHQALEKLPAYLSTFRTRSGKKYGDEYITYGLKYAPEVLPLLEKITEKTETAGGGCPS